MTSHTRVWPSAATNVTLLDWESGKKPVPVMFTRDPPHTPPTVGPTEAITVSYSSKGTPGATRARPRPPSSTKTTTGNSPEEASCTWHTMEVGVADCTMHRDVSPIRTRLPSTLSENPVPVIVMTVPAEMMCLSRPVTMGVRASWYVYWHAELSRSGFPAHDASRPLDHTRTLGTASAVCTGREVRDEE
jgi:hypothetical protein